MKNENKAMIFATTAYMIAQFNKPNIEILQEMGYEVHVATNFENPGPMSEESVLEFKDYLSSRNVKFYQIPIPRNPLHFTSMMKSYRKLKKIMDSYDFSLIHSHSPTGGVIGRLVAKNYRKEGLKSIYTAHGFHFYKGSPVKMWLLFYPVEKVLSIITDTLITINKEDYEISKQKMFAKSTKYIPGVGIDTKTFSTVRQEKNELRTRMGYDANDFIIIYVGELSHRKNQKMIIESLRNLKKIKQLKVLLVGTGPLETEYKKAVEDLNIQECIEFLGYRKDIANLMSIADISISTSRQEGLPVNVMEAMACGLPLVVTNCRGNRDLVKNEINGYIVEIDDNIRFEEKINNLHGNSNLRKRMAFNSKKMISKYDISKIKEFYYEIY